MRDRAAQDGLDHRGINGAQHLGPGGRDRPLRQATSQRQALHAIAALLLFGGISGGIEADHLFAMRAADGDLRHGGTQGNRTGHRAVQHDDRSADKSQDVAHQTSHEAISASLRHPETLTQVKGGKFGE